MLIEDITCESDLVTFLTERNFERQEHRQDLYSIDTQGRLLRVEVLEDLSGPTVQLKRMDFAREVGVQYHLLASRGYSIFAFQRYGPVPTLMTFDKNRRYREDTRKSILKKLNSIQYIDAGFNPTLFSLFEVSEIVKRFYVEFRALRTELANAIKNYAGDSLLLAQVILDRIIFLYFLSVRNVIPERFLTRAYAAYQGSDFYQDVLNPLFFDLLNDEKPPDETVKRFGFQVYLNGGLFNPREGVEILSGKNVIGKARIANVIWKHVFDLLDRYDWVVEEEQEESTTLTPSILGHIYEKSVIEDSQKETGSFYTPQWVTRYIVECTLGFLIRRRLEQQYGNADWQDWLARLRKGEVLEVEHALFLFFEVLSPLKICDNACGSGAFLMAAFSYLFELYLRCIEVLVTDRSAASKLKSRGFGGNARYRIKKHIVTKNLYGVDIQPGAIEIAKLRLWLALVSDMEKDSRLIEPLPNIAYNLMVGDSLVGYVRLPQPLDLALGQSSDEVMEWIDKRSVLVERFRKTTSVDEATDIQREIEVMNRNLRPTFDEMLNRGVIYENMGVSRKELNTLKPFHWCIEFPEVFRSGEEESGFDVIVGNPPYFRLSTKPRFYYDILGVTYDHVFRESNAYAVFIERSYHLLKKGGQMSHIVHKNLFNLDSYAGLRQWLIENTCLSVLTDFGKDVFVGVTAETVTYALRKDEPTKDAVISLRRRELEEGSVTTSGSIAQSVFAKGISPWNHRFVVSMDDEVYARLERMRKGSRPLGELCEISRGIETGENSRFLSMKKKGSTWRPVLRGRDIAPYHAKSHAFIEYEPSKLAGARNPKLLKLKKLITQQNSVVPVVMYDSGEYYVLNSATYITPRDDQEVDLKTLLVILNSPLMRWFFRTVITNFSDITINILPNNLGVMPVKMPKAHNLWHTVADYMVFLAGQCGKNEHACELFQFFDTVVVGSLAEELYLAKGSEYQTTMMPMLAPLDGCKTDRARLECVEQSKILIESHLTGIVKERTGRKDTARFPWP